MANELKLKAYVVFYGNIDAYYAATTASKARYMAYKTIKDMLDPKIKLISLTCWRAYLFDHLADRVANEFGKPQYIPTNWIENENTK